MTPILDALTHTLGFARGRTEVILIGTAALAQLKREFGTLTQCTDGPSKPPGWPERYNELQGVPLLESKTSAPDAITMVIRELEGELVLAQIVNESVLADMLAESIEQGGGFR